MKKRGLYIDAEFVNWCMRSQKIVRADLAKEVGLSNNYFGQVLHNKARISQKSLNRLSLALGNPKQDWLILAEEPKQEKHEQTELELHEEKKLNWWQKIWA